MPVITEQRMRDRNDAILVAARRVFAAKGFEGASIAEIARGADVSDGLIYRYFVNKRDLFYQVLRDFYETLLANVAVAVSAGTFREKIHSFIRSHLKTFMADTDICRLFVTEIRNASDYPGSRLQDLNRRYGQVIVKIVKDGIASGDVRADVDPRVVRDVIFGSVEHLSWAHLHGRGKTRAEETATALTALLLKGVANKTEH